MLYRLVNHHWVLVPCVVSVFYWFELWNVAWKQISSRIAEIVALKCCSRSRVCAVFESQDSSSQFLRRDFASRRAFVCVSRREAALCRMNSLVATRVPSHESVEWKRPPFENKVGSYRDIYSYRRVYFQRAVRRPADSLDRARRKFCLNLKHRQHSVHRIDNGVDAIEWMRFSSQNFPVQSRRLIGECFS